MKLIVFSDSHGDAELMKAALRLDHDAEVVIHLGDGEVEFSELSRLYPQKAFYSVKGNNDWESGSSYNHLLTFGSFRVLCTHGHKFGVKQGLSTLNEWAKKLSADLVLYGHTHVKKIEKRDDVWLMNPGVANINLATASYGVVVLTDKIDLEIKQI